VEHALLLLEKSPAPLLPHAAGCVAARRGEPPTFRVAPDVFGLMGTWKLASRWRGNLQAATILECDTEQILARFSSTCGLAICSA